MSKIGDRQNAILSEFAGRESFKKSEAVDLLKGGYYYNAAKYVGEILSRMVKSGWLTRVSRGVYKVEGFIKRPSSPVKRSDGKCRWCEGLGCLACNSKRHPDCEDPTKGASS